MQEQIIIGVDPGSRHTGFAVLQYREDTYEALQCYSINLTGHEEQHGRLHALYEATGSLLHSYPVSTCAIETPIYGKDPQAMLKLGRAQSAIVLAALNAGITVCEYYPKTVKKSITGRGNAAKDQVAYMLRKMVTMHDRNPGPDATDALAVAWCHVLKTRQTGKVPATDSLSPDPAANRQAGRPFSWNAFVRDNPDRIRS